MGWSTDKPSGVTFNDSTSVKSFTEVPGQAFPTQGLLYVTGCEVYSHRDFVIITVGKTFRDTTSQMVDAHHQFGLVIALLGIGRDKEWLAARKQGGVCLGKNNRFLYI